MLLVGGFIATVLAGSIAAVVVALAIFGFGQAVVYYTARYYAMRVGDADVDAASTHEGLIGVGYAAGPAAAAIGVSLEENETREGPSERESQKASHEVAMTGHNAKKMIHGQRHPKMNHREHHSKLE